MLLTMYIEDIDNLALANDNFRRVLYTRIHSQLVIMSLLPGENIGMETHPTSDQILYIITSEGTAIVDGEIKPIAQHSIIFIPAGSEHDIINNGKGKMKLFTIYAPATHADGIIHKTKADAQKENLT